MSLFLVLLKNFFKVEAFWSADCLPLSQSKAYSELKKKKDSQKDFQKDWKKDVQKDFQIPDWQHQDTSIRQHQDWTGLTEIAVFQTFQKLSVFSMLMLLLLL